MSLNKHYYGVENPSKSRKMIIHSSLLIAVFAIYGTWSDFVPSDPISNFSFVFSLILCVFLSVYTYWVWFKKGIPIKDSVAPSLTRFLIIFFTPFMYYLLAWLVIGHGLPAGYTRLFGNEYSTEVTMTKEKRGSIRSCDYRLIGSPVDNAFPDYICINMTSFDELPIHVPVKLSGYQSITGFLIMSVYVRR